MNAVLLDHRNIYISMVTFTQLFDLKIYVYVKLSNAACVKTPNKRGDCSEKCIFLFEINYKRSHVISDVVILLKST